MPVYLYECDNCGNKFEVTQKFSDDPITKCPRCKKNRVRKLFAPPSIVFKGSGWYATDHRSPSGAGNAKKSEKGSDGSSEKSGDKPAEKASAKTETKSGGGSGGDE